MLLNKNTPSPPPKTNVARMRQPKSRKKIILLGMLTCFVLILAGGWFTLTSSYLFCNYLLPEVSHVLDADLSATEAEIHPFSEIILRNVKFQFNGQPRLAEVAEVKVRYRLGAFFHRRVEVDEIAVTRPHLHVIVKPDGSDNLSGTARRPARPAANNAPALLQPPQISIRNVTIRDGLAEYFHQHANGAQDHYSVSGLNFSLDGLANGAAGKLRIAALLGITQRPPDTGAKAAPVDLKARLTGDLDFELSPALVPKGCKILLSAEVTEATGELAELNALVTRLEFALQQNELKKFNLTFEQRGLELGRVTALGSFDFGKSEGRVEFQIPQLDRKVFNLLGAAQGLDFQHSSVSAHAVVHLTRGGIKLASQGRLTGRALAVKRHGQSTPPLDLDLDYEMKADLTEYSVSLDAFRLTVKQGDNDLLAGWIDFPFGFSWGKGRPTSFTRSALHLAVNDANLADWRAFSGQPSLAGRLGANLVLSATPENRKISLHLQSRLDRFAFESLRQSRLDLQFAGQYSINSDTHLLGGQLTVANPTGAPDDLVPQALQFGGHFDLASQPDLLQLRGASIVVRNGREPAGSIDLGGEHIPSAGRGTFSFKLSGLNEVALRPFTTAALRDRALVTALINGNASLQYEPRNGAAVGAEFTVTNLVLSDLAGTRRSPPFSASLHLDATSHAGQHVLKELTLSLPPTAQAANRLEFTGRADLRNPATTGALLKVGADSLDLTPVIDLLAVKTARPAPAASRPAARAPDPAEPAPVRLPIKFFHADLAIGRLLLRQIIITNWSATVLARENVVTLKPFDLWLNGAPVKLNGELNLGIRGWTYDINCSADKVPLQPVIEGFSPAGTGRVRGDLLFNGHLRGAGLTGVSLRKSLSGEVGFTLMNAEVGVSTGAFNPYLAPVASLLRVPELGAAPINWAGARLTARNGRIGLSETRITSDAFVANLTGSIPIADRLDHSPLDLPVQIELRRSLAARSKLIAPGTPDSPYVPLPDFAKLTGTLAEPKVTFNEAALAGLGLNALAALGGGNPRPGPPLQVAAGLLTSRPAIMGTNAPATNTVPAFNPLGLLKPQE